MTQLLTQYGKNTTNELSHISLLDFSLDSSVVFEYNVLMRYLIYMGLGYIAYVSIFGYVMTTYFGY